MYSQYWRRWETDDRSIQPWGMNWLKPHWHQIPLCFLFVHTADLRSDQIRILYNPTYTFINMHPHFVTLTAKCQWKHPQSKQYWQIFTVLSVLRDRSIARGRDSWIWWEKDRCDQDLVSAKGACIPGVQQDPIWDVSCFVPVKKEARYSKATEDWRQMAKLYLSQWEDTTCCRQYCQKQSARGQPDTALNITGRAKAFCVSHEKTGTTLVSISW